MSVINFDVIDKIVRRRDGFNPVRGERNYTKLHFDFERGYGWDNCEFLTCSFFVSADQMTKSVPARFDSETGYAEFTIPGEYQTFSGRLFIAVQGTYEENGETVTVSSNIACVDVSKGLLVEEGAEQGLYESLMVLLNTFKDNVDDELDELENNKEDKIYKVQSIGSQSQTGDNDKYPSVTAVRDYVNTKTDDLQDYIEGELDGLDEAKADKADTNAQFERLIAVLQNKAGKAETLAGYGITDAYTKTQTNNLLDGKANASHTHSQYLTAHQDISGKLDKLAEGTANKIITSTAGGAVQRSIYSASSTASNITNGENAILPTCSAIKEYVLEELERVGEDVDENALFDAIESYLSSHPELTTTVQDESLTEKKLVKGTLGYITPEMFRESANDSDTVLINRALTFLANPDNNVNTLKFRGEYDLAVPSGQNHCFRLENVSNKVLDFSGAVINIAPISKTDSTIETKIVFRLENCSDIKIIGGTFMSDRSESIGDPLGTHTRYGSSGSNIHCFYLYGGENVSFLNNSFKDMRMDIIVPMVQTGSSEETDSESGQADAEFIVTKNLLISGFTSKNASIPIHLHYCENPRVEGAHIEMANELGSGDHAFYISRGCHNVQISNVYIEADGYCGAAFDFCDYAQNPYNAENYISRDDPGTVYKRDYTEYGEYADTRPVTITGSVDHAVVRAPELYTGRYSKVSFSDVTFEGVEYAWRRYQHTVDGVTKYDVIYKDTDTAGALAKDVAGIAQVVRLHNKAEVKFTDLKVYHDPNAKDADNIHAQKRLLFLQQRVNFKDYGSHTKAVFANCETYGLDAPVLTMTAGAGQVNAGTAQDPEIYTFDNEDNTVVCENCRFIGCKNPAVVNSSKNTAVRLTGCTVELDDFVTSAGTAGTNYVSKNTVTDGKSKVELFNCGAKYTGSLNGYVMNNGSSGADAINTFAFCFFENFNGTAGSNGVAGVSYYSYNTAKTKFYATYINGDLFDEVENGSDIWQHE